MCCDHLADFSRVAGQMRQADARGGIWGGIGGGIGGCSGAKSRAVRSAVEVSLREGTSMSARVIPDTTFVVDLLRGLAVMTGNSVLDDIAKVIETDLRPDLSIAFNRKQIASKLWLLQHLHESWGGHWGRVCVLGGWYGVLSALLISDQRFEIGHITSVDLDPGCAGIAMLLNRHAAAQTRFAARTADMLTLDLRPDGPDAADLLINTSCEHLPDVPAWLAGLPDGQRVVLQSNDYVAVPEHLSSVPSLAAFERQAGLSRVDFAGAFAQRNYTRFMLIGVR